MNFEPVPSLGGPLSISQDEGASTEMIGIWVSSSAWITVKKGSLTGPSNENPNMASTI
jgi:hypothetical protein